MAERSDDELSDEEARRIIREELATTLLVEAAAGTGKTTELVARILAALRTGEARLRELAAVTFTDKAAGELKLRLRTGLERERHRDDLTAEERSHLDVALEELEAASIGTIHGFCSDLLRTRPVEAGVDPAFEVFVDDRLEALRARAFDEWFVAALEDPKEGTRRMLRRRPLQRTDPGPKQLLRRAVDTMAASRDFDGEWRRAPFDRDGEVDDLLGDIRRLGVLGAQRRDYGDLKKNLARFERFASELDSRERALAASEGLTVAPGIRPPKHLRDYDGLEARLVRLPRDYWLWQGGVRGKEYAPGVSKEQVLGARDALKEKLELFKERSDADLAACLHVELRPVVERLEELKDRAGGLDFMDLLLRARDLVKSQPEVRAALQARYRHLFVDEFQDTDPLQAELFILLAASDPQHDDWRTAQLVPGKLFLVGDPKQSIYRFRRADIAVYQEVKARLVEQGGRVVYLRKSFRSVPAIQDFVNAAFAPAMDGTAPRVQPSYVALESHREAIEGQPSVVALPVPRPYGKRGTLTKTAIKDSLPDAVAAWVSWLVRDSAFRVHDADADGADEQGLRAVRSSDICLLFRYFKSFDQDATRPFAQALEARGVPHLLLGGQSFHDREEISAIRSALTAIEWPDDELAIYATLRGPFFSFHDEDLFLYKTHHGRLHTLKPRGEGLAGRAKEIGEALELLAKLHVRRNRRPLADTLLALLDATRVHAGVAIWPAGDQALSNLLGVVDHARRFDARGVSSFRAFVDWLEEQKERSARGDAPVVEEGAPGVRMMTVHKAKGLEFPIVVLCDPTVPLGMRASRWVDIDARLFVESIGGCAPIELLEHKDEVLEADHAEVTRLAYVAATRARDMLVVPTVGDGEFEGWLSLLDPCLYPAPEDRRRAELAPWAPVFGDDSVVLRPSRAKAELEGNVMPGVHRIGTNEVVWWDPGALTLDVPQVGGQRQQELLAADEEGRDAAGEAAHAAWVARRQEAVARGEVPTMSAHTITALSKALPLTERVVEVACSEMPRQGRPRGPRFGTLVHEVLGEADFDADVTTLERLAQAHGRLLGASDAEVVAAAAAAASALAHPLMQQAARAELVRRETALVLRLPDGTLAEGVVDLAFYAEGRWKVVDFKSDLVDEAPDYYRVQVQLYARALEAATGQPADAVLLGV